MDLQGDENDFNRGSTEQSVELSNLSQAQENSQNLRSIRNNLFLLFGPFGKDCFNVVVENNVVNFT